MTPPTQSRTSFATISLNWTDKIRLIQFPPSIAHQMADQLRASWPAGIQAQQQLVNAHEFKLKGTPFGSLGEKEGVAARRLVRDLLAFLRVRGWTLVTPISHSRYPRAKDSLVFCQRRRAVDEKGEQGKKGKGKGKLVDGAEVAPRLSHEDVQIPPPVDWLVLAPTGFDRLRVILDGPVRLTVPPAGLDGLTARPDCSSSSFPSPSRPDTPKSRPSSDHDHDHDELGRLVQRLKHALTAVDYFQSGSWSHDSFEFKLRGYPWQATGEKTVRVERLLLAVLETLDGFGWRSYASVRLRSGSDDVRKSDTMFFVRDERVG